MENSTSRLVFFDGRVNPGEDVDKITHDYSAGNG